METLENEVVLIKIITIDLGSVKLAADQQYLYKVSHLQSIISG